MPETLFVHDQKLLDECLPLGKSIEKGMLLAELITIFGDDPALEPLKQMHEGLYAIRGVGNYHNTIVIYSLGVEIMVRWNANMGLEVIENCGEIERELLDRSSRVTMQLEPMTAEELAQELAQEPAPQNITQFPEKPNDLKKVLAKVRAIIKCIGQKTALW